MERINDPALDLFRSAAQAHMLTWVLMEPERDWTLSELAERIDVAVSTILREVERATAMGVLTSFRVGQTRVVRQTESLLRRHLTELIKDTTGPRHVVTRELAGIDGIRDAFIYGSWAQWYHGETEVELGDIDVIVIGEPEAAALDRAAQSAAESLGRMVNITVRTIDWWKRVIDTEGGQRQPRTRVWNVG